MLSNLYFMALCAVGVALVAAVLDAVVSASRRHEWQVGLPTLKLVEVEDRRIEPLPFVGAERRAGDGGAPTSEDERQVA